MNQRLRAGLLIAAAFLILFGALGNLLVIVPDLSGDLAEIGVRPSVLGGTVLRLHFGSLAMFAFGTIVCAAAIQAIRGLAVSRLPLAVIAVAYVAFGVMAFSRSHNPHHLGPLAAGLLLGGALVDVGTKAR